jgi:hypothetical protein
MIATRLIALSGMFTILFLLGLDGCAREKRATQTSVNTDTTKTSGNTDAIPVQTSGNPDSQVVVLSQGQSTHLPQHPDDALSFVNVPQDSRCPTGVRCVWEGDGTVVLAVLTASTSDTTRIELHTSSKFATQTAYKDLNIRLERLDPYPQKDRNIGPADYVATLSITRR